ncbi:MAG: hypothetical protein FJ291_02145 [Planctomycetes bacterium]|nr:hypothetical protein [Planctomycetota bacterium]
MNGRSVAVVALLGMVALGLIGAGCAEQPTSSSQTKTGAAALQGVPSTSASDATPSGPFQHENLAVFIIQGKNTITGTEFLTLDEALSKKLLVVRETEQVRELTVDNLSEKESIFIQSGEMVSGGKQDRMLGVDLVVPPKARNMKVPSFCVEQSRWSQRGAEAAKVFGTNFNYASSNELRVAARLDKDQGKVWQQVAKSQKALSANVGADVTNATSPSSLDLALEDPRLKAAVKAYTDKLSKAIEGKDDAIGCAFAINGQIYSADVYGSNVLFRKLYPKLLDASATEAVAKLQKDKKFTPPAAEAVTAWLNKPRPSENAKRALTEAVAPAMRARIVETKEDVLLDTVDEKAGASVRKSIMAIPQEEK